MTIAVSPSDRKYNDAQAFRILYENMLERVRQVPGVEAVALSDTLPPDRQSDADTFTIQGQVLAPGELNPAVSDAIISGDYFRAMRIPLLKGRSFTPRDKQDSAPVVIVSDSLARHFFPNQDPLGRRIKQSGPDNQAPFMEGVGVVGDVKYTGLQNDTDHLHERSLVIDRKRTRLH